MPITDRGRTKTTRCCSISAGEFPLNCTNQLPSPFFLWGTQSLPLTGALVFWSKHTERPQSPNYRTLLMWSTDLLWRASMFHSWLATRRGKCSCRCTTGPTIWASTSDDFLVWNLTTTSEFLKRIVVGICTRKSRMVLNRCLTWLAHHLPQHFPLSSSLLDLMPVAGSTCMSRSESFVGRRRGTWYVPHQSNQGNAVNIKAHLFGSKCSIHCSILLQY